MAACKHLYRLFELRSSQAAHWAPIPRWASNRFILSWLFIESNGSVSGSSEVNLRFGAVFKTKTTAARSGLELADSWSMRRVSFRVAHGQGEGVADCTNYLANARREPP